MIYIYDIYIYIFMNINIYIYIFIYIYMINSYLTMYIYYTIYHTSIHIYHRAFVHYGSLFQLLPQSHHSATLSPENWDALQKTHGGRLGNAGLDAGIPRPGPGC